MEKPTRTLASKLNKLFATHPRPGGGEWSNEHVVARIKAEFGKTFSNSYLWQLRNGAKDNPTLRHLQGLAWFFGVSLDYFNHDDVADRIDAKIAADNAERLQGSTSTADPDVQLLAMRAGEMSPARRRQAFDMVAMVYELDQREQAGSSAPSPDDPQRRTLG